MQENKLEKTPEQGFAATVCDLLSSVERTLKRLRILESVTRSSDFNPENNPYAYSETVGASAEKGVADLTDHFKKVCELMPGPCSQCQRSCECQQKDFTLEPWPDSEKSSDVVIMPDGFVPGKEGGAA